MLRLESGIGLWHRQGLPDGKQIHVQARPTQKVMEHLLKMATELGQKSGMVSGDNAGGFSQ
jgi:hypothetical protein